MKSVIQCQKVSKIDLHVSKVVGIQSFHSSLCKGRLTSGARRKMLRDGFLCRHFKSGCGFGLPAVLGAWVFVRKLVERPFLSSGSLCLCLCLFYAFPLRRSRNVLCAHCVAVLCGVVSHLVFHLYMSCLLACVRSCLLAATSLVS